MVFQQMTKTDVLAGRASRDHISDFDIAVCDDYSVDEQLDQFSFLLKTGVFQTRLDAAAEVFDRGDQAHQLVLPVYLMHKLFRLSFYPLIFALQVGSPALVFGQRDDTGQVSLGEPIVGSATRLGRGASFLGELAILVAANTHLELFAEPGR
jgi:hypothetical protein